MLKLQKSSVLLKVRNDRKKKDARKKKKCWRFFFLLIAVYVDEVAGDDVNGTGAEATPFKTVLKAIESKGDNIKIQVKKDAEGYKDVSGAALKKAKKTLAEQQKKAKKLEEQQKKQNDELKKKAEDEAKALEHAKSIVLVEDKSLPKAEKVFYLIYFFVVEIREI